MGEIIQSTTEHFGGSRILQVFSSQTEFTNVAEINRVLEEFHTVDNDKLLIRITSCPGHDSPKSASLRWGTWDKSPISTATNITCSTG